MRIVYFSLAFLASFTLEALTVTESRGFKSGQCYRNTAELDCGDKDCTLEVLPQSRLAIRNLARQNLVSPPTRLNISGVSHFRYLKTNEGKESFEVQYILKLHPLEIEALNKKHRFSPQPYPCK
jgi:hypothetical protein